MLVTGNVQLTLGDGLFVDHVHIDIIAARQLLAVALGSCAVTNAKQRVMLPVVGHQPATDMLAILSES